MKRSEMVIVGAAYSATAAVAYGALHLLGRGQPIIALVVAPAVGTLAGSWVFSRRVRAIAGLKVKVQAGVVMGGLCLAVSLVGQAGWEWMAPDPYTMITMLVSGTFVFPIIFFGSMELIFLHHRDAHGKRR